MDEAKFNILNPFSSVDLPSRCMAMSGIGYEYASGMYTAYFWMILAITALVKKVREHPARRVAP